MQRLERFRPGRPTAIQLPAEADAPRPAPAARACACTAPRS